MMKNWIIVFCFLIASLRLAPCAFAGDITVLTPWIPEPPPVARTLAGYMTLENHSDVVVKLQEVTCPDFARIEIHKTSMHGDMALMMKQPELAIEGGKSLVLEPGGYHLMLMQAKRKLLAGDMVTLTLKFDNGEVVEVQTAVRTRKE